MRLVTAGLLLVAYPLILRLPTLAELAVVTGLMIASLIVEAIIHADTRRQIRDELTHH